MYSLFRESFLNDNKWFVWQRLINSAITKIALTDPAEKPKKLYHAISHTNLRLTNLAGVRGYNSYDIAIPTFISTTPILEVARGYIGKDHCGTILSIDIENGMNNEQIGEHEEDSVKYPLKYFCADISWISKFHDECEYLMHPAFLDTIKIAN